MSYKRHKNVQWNLPEQPLDWTQVNSALLMDIRDELQALNRVIYCPNVQKMALAMIEMNRRLERNYRLALKRRKAKGE